MYAVFPVFFNQRSINKITSRIRCTSTQDISWENPHGGEKPNKPFPYIRVSFTMLMTSLGMPLAKPQRVKATSLEQGANQQKKSLPRTAQYQEQKCAT